MTVGARSSCVEIVTIPYRYAQQELTKQNGFGSFILVVLQVKYMISSCDGFLEKHFVFFPKYTSVRSALSHMAFWDNAL